MHVENAAKSGASKGKRPQATAPRVANSSRGGSFEPIRNPYRVGFQGPARAPKKADK